MTYLSTIKSIMNMIPIATPTLDYHSAKLAKIQTLEASGVNVYPHKFQISKTFEEFITHYKDHLKNEEIVVDKIESLAGRVMDIRTVGKKLCFYSVRSNGFNIQFVQHITYFADTPSFESTIRNINRGDIIGVNGHPGKTRAGKTGEGELSLFPKSIILLTPCLHTIPKSFFGLQDEEMRVTKRYVDLMVNDKSIKTFKTNHVAINFIRQYLNNMDFIEVQTPILSSAVGGANAKPFKTYHNDLKKDMFLRIAPELYLKKLVVGGLDRVYELGPQFRNETIDSSHQTEFWSMEFYMAYADYEDLITMCEDMLSKLVNKITGTNTIKYQLANSQTSLDLDFSLPFKRIDIVEELDRQLQIDLNMILAKDPEALRQYLIQICDKHKVECSEPKTSARLLDKLIGEFIEPLCINPTFVCNHPVIMSPLSKQHRENPLLTERFELFINSTEYANAYTELNDPRIQKQRFESQLLDKNMGDDEAQEIDHSFIDALEHGLPPCGGFGLGISRMVMLLTNNSKIRDVLTFPVLY